MATIQSHLDASGTEISIECEVGAAVSKYGSGGGDPFKAYQTAMTLAGQVAAQLARQVSGAMKVSGAVIEADFAVKINGKGIVTVAQTPDNGQFHISIKFSPPKR